MTSAESSMLDHPPPTPPHLTAYSLRWVGKALEIRHHYWHGPLADSQETDADRQTLFSAVRTLNPRAVIVDLQGIEMMSAIRLTVLVRLAKELDVIKHPGRVVLINVSPDIVQIC